MKNKTHHKAHKEAELMLRKMFLKSICYIILSSAPCKYFAAILAGGILFFAFAPFSLYPLAIIALILLLWSWHKLSPRQTFIAGLLFGISFFALGASWIYISLHQYGFMPIPLALFVTVLFVLFLALFPATQGCCLNKFLSRYHAIKILLAFPLLYTLSDWIRSWIFTGFPWLNLGYSQIDSPLRGLAPIVGVYGIAFVVAFSASTVIYLLLTKNRKLRFLPIIAALTLWLGSANLSTINWTKPYGKPIKVSLIQGNIAQEIKWQQEQLPSILQQYYADSSDNWQSQIIVWPEAAIPTFPENIPSFIDKLNQEAKAHHTTIISGIPLAQFDAINNKTNYYNAIASFGAKQHYYYKRHLVPFGEYTPLPKIFQWCMQHLTIPMSDFAKGPQRQQPFDVNGIIIAPFVCYEIAYPSLALDYLPQAHLFLTVSDDSWFGRSVAATQHLEIARMRSAESGRYQLVTTNTGVTAVIDDHGYIVKQAPSFQRTVVNSEVQPMQGATPWVKLWMKKSPTVMKTI